MCFKHAEQAVPCKLRAIEPLAQESAAACYFGCPMS